MAFHLGRKEFVENLSSDVLDVDTTLRRLAKRLPDNNSAHGEPVLRSWKYPGTSYLDVDTQNLVKCFRFNPRCPEESRKAHLLMTELLIDRLNAFTFVCALLMEGQMRANSQNAPMFERKITDRNSIGSVANYFAKVFNLFLMAWDINLPHKDLPVDQSCQTEETFKPHDPCPECLWKNQWLKKTENLLTDSVNCPPEVQKYPRKLKQVYDNATADHLSTMDVLTMADSDATILSSNISKLKTDMKNHRKSTAKMKKDIMRTCLGDVAARETLQQLHQETVKLQQEEVPEKMQEHQALIENVREISSTCEKLKEQLARNESKTRARKRVYELSAMASREENAALLESTKKMRENIRELEQIFDPDWQTKLYETGEKVKSLEGLRSDAESLCRFNEGRIADLKLQLTQVTRQNRNLEFELKSATRVEIPSILV